MNRDYFEMHVGYGRAAGVVDGHGVCVLPDAGRQQRRHRAALGDHGWRRPRQHVRIKARRRGCRCRLPRLELLHRLIVQRLGARLLKVALERRLMQKKKNKKNNTPE
jgi:hypothetical protein